MTMILVIAAPVHRIKEQNPQNLINRKLTTPFVGLVTNAYITAENPLSFATQYGLTEAETLPIFDRA